MDPVTAILSAAALAGGIFGGQRKHIDPEWLRRHFGPQAVSKEALDLFNNILNSPHGQQLMQNAAEQGQQFSRNVNRSAAQAGLSGAGGADSGTGIFATNAAQGATDSFQRDIQSQMYQSVMPVAQDMVNNRMSAYLQDFYKNGAPTNAATTWQKIGDAAGSVGSLLPAPQPKQVNTGMAGPLAPQMPNPIPGGDDRIRSALGQTQPILDPMKKTSLFGSRLGGMVRPSYTQSYYRGV